MKTLRFFSRTKRAPAIDRDHVASAERKNIEYLLSRLHGGRAQYMEHNYRNYALEGYSKNEVIYACINERSTAFADAPLNVYRDTVSGPEEVPGHGLKRVMDRPNDVMSAVDFWEATMGYFDISGNAFWWKVRSAAGRVVELWPLRPDRMRIIPDSQDYIRGYQYEVDGQRYSVDRNDIVHFKRFHPTNDYFGLPPLAVAARATASDNEATDFVKAVLQNSAQYGVAITTEDKVDDSIARRIIKQWKQKFGGKRRGEPALLQKGMDVKPISMTLKDLEFPNLRNISETRICAVYQVPPIVIGLKVGLERSTFANYEEARKSFWEETILPLMGKFQSAINRHLTPEYGDETVYCQFDTSGVRALQEKEDAKWARADKAVNSGWIMINEARSIVGLDRDEGGDVYIRKPLNLEVPAGGGDALDRSQEPGDSESPDKADPFPEAKALGLMFKGAEDQAWRARRKIEDAGARQVEEAFLKAVENMKDNADSAAVRKAIEAGEYDRAADLLGFEQFGKDLQASKKAITAIVAASGALAAQMLTDSTGMAVDFDLLAPGVVKWLNTRSADLVVEISDETRKAIRETLAHAAERGIGPKAMGRRIRTHVGLTTRDSTAVMNYWAKLLEDHPDNADDMADTYAKRLLKRRGENIARTESSMAYSAGQQELWNQAAEEGLIDPAARKEWITTPDDRLCPACAAMHGQQVPLGSDFVSSDYGNVPAPPLHPSCRCDMKLITK